MTDPAGSIGLPGMPASTMRGNEKLGWLNTLKNRVSQRSFTFSFTRKHFIRYKSLHTNCQFGDQAPALGSTEDTNAFGFSHCTVPGCVIPGIASCSYNGTPGSTLANCGPLPFTMPLPFAEYGVLNTENYGVKSPAAYRDWQFIAVNQLLFAGKGEQLRAQLGNDIAIKAFKEGMLPFPDRAMIARFIGVASHGRQ